MARRCASCSPSAGFDGQRGPSFATLALTTWLVVHAAAVSNLPGAIVVAFIIPVFLAFLLWSFLLLVVAILRVLSQLIRVIRASRAAVRADKV